MLRRCAAHRGAPLRVGAPAAAAGCGVLGIGPGGKGGGFTAPGSGTRPSRRRRPELAAGLSMAEPRARRLRSSRSVCGT